MSGRKDHRDRKHHERSKSKHSPSKTPNKGKSSRPGVSPLASPNSESSTRPSVSPHAPPNSGNIRKPGVSPLAPLYLEYVRDLASLEVIDKLPAEMRHELLQRINLIQQLACEESQYIQFIVDTCIIELSHFVSNVIPKILDQGTIEKLRKEVSSDCKKTFAFLRDCAAAAPSEATPSGLQLLGATAADPTNSPIKTSQDASGEKNLSKMFAGIAALQRECKHEGCTSTGPPNEEFKFANTSLKDSNAFDFRAMAAELNRLQKEYHFLKSHSAQNMDVDDLQKLGLAHLQLSAGAATAASSSIANDSKVPRGFWFENKSPKGSLSYTYHEALPLFEYLVRQNPKEVDNQLLMKIFLRLAINRPPALACAMYIIDDDQKADKTDICLLATAISLLYPKSEMPMMLDDLVPEKSCFRHKVSKSIIRRAGKSLREKVCALKAAHLVAVEMWFFEKNSSDMIRRLTEAGRVTLRLALRLGHNPLALFPGHSYLCARANLTRGNAYARKWPGPQEETCEFQLPAGMDPYLRDQLYIGLTPKKSSSNF